MVGNTIENGGGVRLVDVSLATVSYNALNNSSTGVELLGGSGDRIVHNQITNCSSGTGFAVRVNDTTDLSVASNFAPFSARGIVIGNSSDVSVVGNNISFELHHALPHGGIGLATDARVVVQGNYVYDDAFGLWAIGSSQLTVAGNFFNSTHDLGVELLSSNAVTIVNNTLADGAGAAAYVWASANVSVTDNAMPHVGSGPEISDSANVTVSGNYISNAGTGLTIDGATGAQITDNEFDDDAAAAVLLSSGGVRFAENTVLGSVVGVSADGDWGLDLADNVVFQPTVYGLDLDLVSNALATGNTINGSGIAAVHVDDPTGTVTVADNVLTWAAGTGVDIVAVSGNVTVNDNDLDHALNVAVGADPGAADLSVVGNTILSAVGGISVQDAAAAVVVERNDIAGSSAFGLTIVNSSGARLQVLGNNLSNSAGDALDLNHAGTGATGTLEENNASGSAEVLVNATEIDLGIVGNDLLQLGETVLTHDNFGPIYHNDFDSSNFNATGTFTFSEWNASYPIAGNYWSGYAGADRWSGPSQNLPGADGIGDTPYVLPGVVDAYPLMHPWVDAQVSFAEVGLPGGTPWSVRLNGVTGASVAGTPIRFDQTDGADTAFGYTVFSSPDYSAAPAAGSGVENGTNQTVKIVFAPVLFRLHFTESGLPHGVGWSVTVTSVRYPVSGDSTNVSVMNGSYAYVVGHIAGFTVSSPSGTAVVAGAGETFAFTFAPYTYAVTFAQSGLPTGTVWEVELGGQGIAGHLSNVTFPEANATYAFAVTTPSGYQVTPSGGELQVNGTNVVVYLAFSKVAPSHPALTSTEEGLLVGVVALAVLAVAGWAYAMRGRRGGPAAGATSAPPADPASAPGEPPASPPSG